jgi:hypothetical protein
MKYFSRHLKESNLNYAEHFICAWVFAILHLAVVPVALIHGVLPFLLPGLGKRLHARIHIRYDSLVKFFQTQNR